MEQKRYILNEHGSVHDREKLTERCNTDDIVERRDIDFEELTELRSRRTLFACMQCMPFGLPGSTDLP